MSNLLIYLFVHDLAVQASFGKLGKQKNLVRVSWQLRIPVASPLRRVGSRTPGPIGCAASVETSAGLLARPKHLLWTLEAKELRNQWWMAANITNHG